MGPGWSPRKAPGCCSTRSTPARSAAIGAEVVSADAAGVLGRPGASVGGRCALPPAGAAGVSLALVTTDGLPVLAPGGKAPLTCTPDAKGDFRFDGIALRGELLVQATLGPDRGQLLALATPDGVSRCDLPGTLAVLGLLAAAPPPDWTAAPLPLATFAALADALAALPVPKLEAMGTTPEAVRAALNALRASDPAVDAALQAIDAVILAPPADGVIGHIKDGAAS